MPRKRQHGGVHLHQVRQGKGGWQKRVVDSNGVYRSAGKIEAVADADGEALFVRAAQE